MTGITDTRVAGNWLAGGDLAERKVRVTLHSEQPSHFDGDGRHGAGVEPAQTLLEAFLGDGGQRATLGVALVLEARVGDWWAGGAGPGREGNEDDVGRVCVPHIHAENHGRAWLGMGERRDCPELSPAHQSSRWNARAASACQSRSSFRSAASGPAE